jgi:hypothetical protein
VSVTRASDGVVEDYVTLHYSGSSFPYKTTMKSEATPWLLYDKYNPNTTTNEFEVEFEGGISSWAGKVEDNVTSTDKGSRVLRTNRRTLW